MMQWRATKNFCCSKDEGTVQKLKGFKKFGLGSKHLNDHVQSNRLKTMDSETVLQAIEVNLMCTTWRVSGEFGVS